MQFERLKRGKVSDDSWLNCSKSLRAFHSLQLIKPQLTWTHQDWANDLPQEKDSDIDLDAEIDALFSEPEEDDVEPEEDDEKQGEEDP